MGKSVIPSKPSILRAWATAMVAVGLLVAGGCRPPSAGDKEPGPPEVAVEVARLVRAPMQAEVEVYGTVVSNPPASGDPGGMAMLAAPGPGIVSSIPVQEGDRVAAGDLVVRLDDREALAAIEQAQASVTLAEQAMTRQKRLEAWADSSEKAAQEAAAQLATARAELRRAEARLALVQLRSPLAGVVAHIRVHPGQAVDGNTGAVEIIDPTQVEVDARVPAGEARQIQVGQTATIQAADNSAAQIAGEVRFVGVRVDPATDTRRVRLALSEAAGWLPGEFVRVRIVTETRPDCLVAPLASVYTSETGESILFRVEEGVARRQRVTLGLRDARRVEVQADGLAAGDLAVTVGAYALPDGARVRIQEGVRGQ